ncbi:rod shape-determining protein MreD [bacterium]|nr:rod shape-determining protein MreD [bacterium]
MPNEILKLSVWGILIFLIQIAVAPLLEIKGIKPDLLLIFVIAVTIRRGSYAGLAAGFAMGFAQDLVSIGFLGVMVLAKSTVAFWSGKWLENRDIALSPLGWLILIIIAALSQGFLVSLFVLQGSQVSLINNMFYSVIPVSIYTGIIGFIWALAPLGRHQAARPTSLRIRRKG